MQHSCLSRDWQIGAFMSGRGAPDVRGHRIRTPHVVCGMCKTGYDVGVARRCGKHFRGSGGGPVWTPSPRLCKLGSKWRGRPRRRRHRPRDRKYPSSDPGPYTLFLEGAARIEASLGRRCGSGGADTARHTFQQARPRRRHNPHVAQIKPR